MVSKVFKVLLLLAVVKQVLFVCRKVDSWFLDGFSPAVNPEMWSEEIFFYMRKLSHEQSSFSSYSAASLVQKRLRQAG